MEKFWTQFYPVEVPKELPPSEFKSLNEFFDKKFAEFADLPFTSNMGVTLSYAQAVSAWLQSIGLAKGSTVALMMPNVHQYLPVLVAIVRAGYVLTTVIPDYHIASTPNRSIIALKQVIKQGQHLDLGFKKANVISTCQTNP